MNHFISLLIILLPPFGHAAQGRRIQHPRTGLRDYLYSKSLLK